MKDSVDPKTANWGPGTVSTGRGLANTMTWSCALMAPKVTEIEAECVCARGLTVARNDSVDWPGREEITAGTCTEGSLAETIISVPSGRLAELNCRSQVTLSPACTCFGIQNSSAGRIFEGEVEIAGVAVDAIVV